MSPCITYPRGEKTRDPAPPWWKTEKKETKNPSHLHCHSSVALILPPFLALPPPLLSARTNEREGRAGQRARPRPREGGRKESASNYATNRCCKNSEQPTVAASAAAALPEVALAAPPQPLPPPPSPGWFYCPKRMEGRDGGKTWPYVRRAEGRGRRMHEARFPFNIFRRVLPLWGVETGEGGRDGEGQRRLL